MYFIEWGDLSISMYNKVLPQECILCMWMFPQEKLLRHGRRIHLSVYAISKFLSAPKSGRGDEDPPAIVFDWHKEDNKHLLRASISVHKMEDTISCYQSYCFGMKLLRQEDA